MRRAAERPSAPAVDMSKFDLNTEEGLRGAVQALITEVQSLRAEVAANRGGGGNMQRPAQREAAQGNANPNAPKAPFPGAVPTDPTLEGQLRRFIKPTNDNATVDAILAEVIAHIKDSPDLKQQAIDGWTRVLHFGETYGNEYSRAQGKYFLEELKKQTGDAK